MLIPKVLTSLSTIILFNSILVDTYYPLQIFVYRMNNRTFEVCLVENLENVISLNTVMTSYIMHNRSD